MKLFFCLLILPVIRIYLSFTTKLAIGIHIIFHNKEKEVNSLQVHQIIDKLIMQLCRFIS